MKLALDFSFDTLNASALDEVATNIGRSLVVLLDKDMIFPCYTYYKDIDFNHFEDAPHRAKLAMLNALLPERMELNESLARLLFNPEDERNWKPLLGQLKFDRVLKNDLFLEMFASLFDLKPHEVNNTGFDLGLEMHYGGLVFHSEDDFYDAFDAAVDESDVKSSDYRIEYSARAGVLWGRLVDWCEDQRVARVWLPKEYASRMTRSK